jgi:hypothetical protein
MYSNTMNNTCDNVTMNHISDPCNVDYYSTGLYDNGHLVYKVNEPSDDELDAKPQLQLETPCVSPDIVYNGLPSNESIDSQYKSRSPKRAASEINGTEHESGSPKPAKAHAKPGNPKQKALVRKLPAFRNLAWGVLFSNRILEAMRRLCLAGASAGMR